ncbi:MAG: hypothetical protein K6A14_00145 [Erysipelotrichaceae bacterium]|nr:hypothetical protein [Erysipelotrichaceae bacterium]
MKKIMKCLALLMLAVSLTGCSRHLNSYRAIGLFRSSNSRKATLNFYRLNGRIVFSLRYDDGQRLVCTGHLQEGNVTVYYDIEDTENQLFALTGEQETSQVIAMSGKGSVYVIIETDGECINGSFSFAIE